VDLLGEMGPRVESLGYSGNRVVAVSSSDDEQDAEEAESASGAVVVATIKDGKNSPVAFSISQMLKASATPLSGVINSMIRRPCNLGR